MSKVIAVLTTSVDGYFVGPNDGPEQGLGEGGERLHYWVFGGAWSYDQAARGDMDADDAHWFNAIVENMGAVVGGRWTYEAAGHWGGRNPWRVPFFIVTHRPQEQPADAGFLFVDGVAPAIDRAVVAAGGKNVQVMGGGDIIRQALSLGLVDELIIIIAPVILGGGKRLFDGFTARIDVEQIGARQSRLATFLEYRVSGAGR